MISSQVVAVGKAHSWQQPPLLEQTSDITSYFELLQLITRPEMCFYLCNSALFDLIEKAGGATTPSTQKVQLMANIILRIL